MKVDNHVSIIIFLLSGLFLLTNNTILFAHGEFIIVPVVINVAPVLDKIESTDLLYKKGDGRVSITSTLIITDADNKNLSSATLRITSGFNTSEDILRFSNQHGISGSWNQASGILSLTGSSSIANYQRALRSIQYENTNTLNPSAVTRVVSFTVNDGQETSNTVSRNIVINSPNSFPVLSNIETVPLVYCIHSGASLITSTLKVVDPDNTNLTSANVQFTTGYTPNEDFLRFTNQNGITGSWDPSTGKLSLSGVTLIANYQTALRSIRYENTNSVNPITGNHVIAFTVNDGTGNSNTVTRSIGVNGRVRAVLTGSAGICSGEITTAQLSIDFSGTPPWTFTLIRDNGNDVIYKDITLDPYTFTVNHEGTYRVKSISDAHCTGDTAGSGYARITFKAQPTAIISGVDTICLGDTASLQITLTGTAPWSITYRRNGANSKVVNNITSSNYTLRVTQVGTYTLFRVDDALCTGKTSGQGIVRSYTSPTATLSGSASICEYTSANLTVVLTGTAPWKFSYRRNAGNPIVLSNIPESPKTVSVQKAGTYTLYEVYDKNCMGTVSGSATINTTPAPHVTLSGLAPAYNHQSPEWVPLTGTPPGGTFSGPGVIPYNLNWYFVPSLPPVGTYNIVYAYQVSPGSCYGYDTAVVRVLEASAVIEFENDRTKYCRNDHPFTVTAVNLSNAIGSFKISGGVGLVDHHNNKATISPAQLGDNEYTITYTYFDGTSLSVDSKFEIVISPAADFKWESECYHAGQSIAITNTSSSTFGNITGYKWKVYKASGYESYSTRDITYTFPQAGNHTIELQIQTSIGCADTVNKVLDLRPIVDLSEQNYDENFEDSPLSWRSGTSSEVTVNSWRLGNPSKGFSGASSGTKCWYTYIAGTPAPREQSWVTSPCFDFTGTVKPMIKMDIWRWFNVSPIDLPRDGAVLQASADSGKTWSVVGLLQDGINWFNEYNIVGSPGNQQIGWGNLKDLTWIESRHGLDLYKNKREVQFRLAYGSDGTAYTNGIAFDNFWIGERNRTALLEHFTNASDEDCAVANTQLNSLVNDNESNIIDLQFHTSFPGQDPFNQHNPSVPGARVFYYGISSVPYTILDGGSKSQSRFDYDTKPFDQNAQNATLVESLLESKFWINLNSKVTDNTLKIGAQITPREDIPATELTVHLAVIERVITGVTGNNGETSFESVVKTMLPDAAGTTIYQAWNKDEPRIIEQSWNMQHVYKPAELRVVAFIQNESTNEVYQVALDTIGSYVGIPDYLPESLPEKSFIVFPSPAERTAYVKLNKETVEDITLEVFNNVGSLVFVKPIPAGTDATEIPVDNYPDGIYIVRLLSCEQLIGIGRLTISKQN